jgi:hypothetical protein
MASIQGCEVMRVELIVAGLCLAVVQEAQR